MAGCAVAAAFGVFDVQRLIEAPWVDIPGGEWPGLDLTPGAEFWALLPVFVLVTLVAIITGIGDGIVMQSAALRRPRATDFRIVQGTLNANGVGFLLSGMAGTLPLRGYAAVSTSLVSLTGVASRRVGYAIGAIFVGLAILPKLTTLLLVVPDPVVGVYLIIVMGLLFVAGMRTVFQDGIDFRNATIVGLAFWIGVGAQNQAIFADQLSGVWSILLGNGITVGALAAILMTSFIELTSPRRRRLEVELDISALPQIDAFLRELASKLGWHDASTDRLRAAGEETLSSLLQPGHDNTADSAPHLILVARPHGGTVEMEFMAVFEEENLEDRLAYLSEQAETQEEGEISFRLLRHYASFVRHRKYHGVDIVTVQVEGSR